MALNKPNICKSPTIYPLPYIKLLILLLSWIVVTQQQCCVKFQNKKCVQCPSSTHLYMGNCIFDIENCIRYAGGFYCTKCQQGYELMDDNTCVGMLKQVNVTEGDVGLDGFGEIGKEEIDGKKGNFNTAFSLLLSGKDIPQYKKEQLLQVFNKSVIISSHPFQIYRLIIQTKSGFDDLLFAYETQLNTSQTITKKSFNKISQTQPRYSYIDLKSDPIHEFILSQIQDMNEFMKGGRSVFEESEEMDSYMVEKRVNGTVLDSYLIYFVNMNYGLIEIGFDLEVQEANGQVKNDSAISNATKNSTTNGTSSTNSTTNSGNGNGSGLVSDNNTKTNSTNNSFSYSGNQNSTSNGSNPKQSNSSTNSNSSNINQSSPNTSNIANQTSTQNETKTSNTTSNNYTPINNSTLINSSNPISNSSSTNNSSSIKNSSDSNNSTQTNTSSNSSNSTQSNTTTTNSTVPVTTDPNMVFLRNLLSMYNYSSIQNYTALTDDSFQASPVAPKLIEFLTQNRPTLIAIHHPTSNSTTDHLLDSAYKILPVKQILEQQKQRGVVMQQTIDQFQKEIQLDSLVCVLVRLTYEIDQLQPYQIKTIVLAKLNKDKLPDSNTSITDINSSTISFLKIVEQIGRPQTTFIDQSLSPPPSLSQQIINYPQKQQQFIQRVQFFLELQYPQIMQGSQLINVTYQQVKKLPQEIKNLSSIKDEEIRKIQEKNVFGNLYRMYIFMFGKGEGTERKEYKWKLQFKDNQLDLLELPKDATNSSQPKQDDGSLSTGNNTSGNQNQNNQAQNNNTNNNLTNNNISQSQTNPTTQTPTPSSASTITTDTSPEQAIYKNLFINSNTTITDRYILQLQKLIKSFYSSQLNGNGSGKYELALTGLKTKYIVNTTISLNPATNLTQTNVTRTEDQKIYRLWYVLTKFTKEANATVSQEVDNEKVYGYELGVSSKGLVTLYKVNVMKRSQFATQFSDCIYGNGAISQNASTNGTTQKQALKDFLNIIQNLQPNVESFTTNKIVVDSTVQQGNSNTDVKNGTQIKSNSSVQNDNSNTQNKVDQNNKNTLEQITNQQTKEGKVENEVEVEKIQNLSSFNSGSEQKVGKNESQNINNQKNVEKENQTSTTLTSTGVQKNQSEIPAKAETNNATQNVDAKVNSNKSFEPIGNGISTVTIVQTNTTSIQTARIQNPTPPISEPVSPQATAQAFPSPPPINSSFSSMVQFRKSDPNFVKLLSFIHLVDPSKQASDQNDIKTIYRVEWESNYLRYLVVFKNGSAANESGTNTKDDNNDTFYDESPLNVFELEIEKNLPSPITNGMVSFVEKNSRDDTAGEVVIVSINEESKQKEYQNMIKASKTNNNNNSSNTTNKPSLSVTTITDYYYYNKIQPIQNTSIKGSAQPSEQKQQNKQSSGISNETSMKNRILQELLSEINNQESTKLNNVKQSSNPSSNLNIFPDVNSNSYPSLTQIKSNSQTKSENLRKQDSTPSTIQSSLSQITEPLPKTRKWIGFLQISGLSQQSNKINSLDKHQNKDPQYIAVTILLELPASDNTNKNMSSTAISNNSLTVPSNGSLNNLTTNTTSSPTYPNTTLTISLHSFIFSMNNSQALSPQLPVINSSQKPSLTPLKLISIKSSSVLTKQKYRFGKMIDSNKRIDEFIKKEEQKYLIQNSSIKMEGNQISVPRKIATIDPYFQASQQFVVWGNMFFLKSFTQKDITITFIQPKEKNSQQSNKKTHQPTAQQLEYIRLITALQSLPSTSPQFSKHLSEFQSFMARNFRSISYSVRYLVANYEKESADEYLAKVEYNDSTKRYDVVETKLERRYSLAEIQRQLQVGQNYRTIDPTLHCQVPSKQYKLKCLKCKEGYLLTNFYELFVTSQGRQTSNGVNAPTICSRQIDNCKYQFLDECVECSDGYRKVTDADVRKVQQAQYGQCVKITA